MGAIRGLASAIAVAMIALAAACGGGSSSNVATTPSAEASALRDQVVEAMKDAESFRAVFSSGDSSFTTEIVEPST